MHLYIYIYASIYIYTCCTYKICIPSLKDANSILISASLLDNKMYDAVFLSSLGRFLKTEAHLVLPMFEPCPGSWISGHDRLQNIGC